MIPQLCTETYCLPGPSMDPSRQPAHLRSSASWLPTVRYWFLPKLRDKSKGQLGARPATIVGRRSASGLLILRAEGSGTW